MKYTERCGGDQLPLNNTYIQDQMDKSLLLHFDLLQSLDSLSGRRTAGEDLFMGGIFLKGRGRGLTAYYLDNININVMWLSCNCTSGMYHKSRDSV